MPIKDYPEADRKMRASMLKQYGEEKGNKIWYATMNKRKKGKKDATDHAESRTSK